MAGVLMPRLLALATTSLAALVLLFAAWRLSDGDGDLTLRMAQSGLGGIGFFVIALLAGELAARLAREEMAARGSLELARQQAQLNRLVIQEMSDGVMVVDRNLRVRAANPAARALLVSQGLAPRAPFALDALASWRPLMLAAGQAFESGRWPSAGREVALDFDDGQTRTLRVRVRFTRPVDEASDTLANEPYCVLLLEDVRTAQARLRQEKLAAMGRVSAGIAHEIRNPLAAISQANALLLEEPLPAAQQRLARMVADNVQRLKRIVDDVMELAPGEAGTAHPIDATASLGAAAADWAQTAGLPLAASSRLRVELPDEPLGVLFDTDHLRRVLVNLLDNALRHASDQRGAILLRLAPRDSATVLMQVFSDGDSDRPGGRALPVRALLLDPQPRLRAGLVYLPRAVRALRREHRLPPASDRRAAAQRVRRHPAARAAARRGGHAATERMNTPSAAPRLLVVDDEPDLRTLYELTLVREGYEVDSAGTVEEAWEQLGTQAFDLLITDMRLPDGTGLDLLARLDESGRSEKAIVITAYGSAENAVEALKAGAYDYLTKPVDLRQFRAVVASALGRTPAAPAPAAAAPGPAAAPRRAQRTGAGRAGPPGRRVERDAAGALDGPQGRAQHGAGAGAGRVRHRQGTGGARHPRRVAAHRASLRRGQLRRDPRAIARGRVLRLPQGRLHGRQRGPRGLLPGRPGRHAVPRRDRRPAAGDAEQVAARRAGACGAPGRRGQRAADQCADRQRHAQGPRPRGAGGAVPAGPVLPAQRDPDRACRRCASGSRTWRRSARRCSSASRAMPASRLRPGSPPTRSNVLRTHAFPGNVRELENLLHRALAMSGSDRIEAHDLGLAEAAPAAIEEARAAGCATAAGGRRCPPASRPTSIRSSATSSSARSRSTASIARRRARASGCRCARCATGWRAWVSTPAPATPPLIVPTAVERLGWRGGWWRAARRRPSPNHGPRPRRRAVTLAVVHSISLPPGIYGGREIEHFFTNRLDASAHPYFASLRGVEVSAHFLIRRDGAVLQFVSCDRRAWHAGVSSWRGRDNCNDHSIGIELEGLEGETFEAAQYRALARVLRAVSRRYPVEEVVGHEQSRPAASTTPAPDSMCGNCNADCA